jgi:hypothetical protein
MKISTLMPLTTCLLLGCSSQPSQPQKPTPTTRSSPTDAQTIEMERQREKQMPCSAEWLKTATEAKEELPAAEFDQSGDECIERPSAFRKDARKRFRQ